MIKGVHIKKLIKHEDHRGFFAEILKENDKFFKHIKQTSYTETNPGIIKAFHYHKLQDDIWFIAKGKAKVVLFDLRNDSETKHKTQIIETDENNPLLIFIPKLVAHGYQVLGNKPVCLFYHTTESYNPDDEHRIPFNSKLINFKWQS